MDKHDFKTENYFINPNLRRFCFDHTSVQILIKNCMQNENKTHFFTN